MHFSFESLSFHIYMYMVFIFFSSLYIIKLGYIWLRRKKKEGFAWWVGRW